MISGLDNCVVDTKPYLFIKKGSDFRVVVDNEHVACAADCNGAIDIWQDDDYLIRCRVWRNLRKIEEAVFEDDREVIKWANKWLKKIK